MRARAFEQGMALVSALLLLLVTTMLGVAMFRSFNFLEGMAGNTREKQRATHAAEAAQNYAEWWLLQGNGANATTGTSCAAGIASAPMICSSVITAPTTLPWTTGVAYTPPGMNVGAIGVVNNYVSAPTYYISWVSGTFQKGATTNTYQIDALGYAGTTNSAAVVESGYKVTVMYNNSWSRNHWKDLSGP